MRTRRESCLPPEFRGSCWEITGICPEFRCRTDRIDGAGPLQGLAFARLRESKKPVY
jgi:hypothetical protein